MRKIIQVLFIFLAFLFPFVLIACAGIPVPVIVNSDQDAVPDNYDNRHDFTKPKYYDRCPKTTPASVPVDKYGCPYDSDNDGVPDYLDKCPNTPAGVKVDKDGCPLDSDGDGVPDYLDKCPDTPAGVKVDKDGCPFPVVKKEEPKPDCKDPKTLVVLMPDKDGKVGEVDVSSTAGSQGLSKAWESAEVKCPDQKPAPKTMDEKAVRETFKEALDAQPSPPVSFIMYFKSGSATPMKKSKKLIPEIVNAVKSNKAVSVIVAGHTDTVASDKFNKKLSERRAKAVSKLLVSKGVDKKIIEIEFYGEEKLLVSTPDNVNEPGNRRVEVIVR
jgi:outer membrane protein OmpA-like peptidoglycan-associated protein